MLIDHMEEPSYALENGIDSSLHEWSDNRLPPLRLGVQNNQDEGRQVTLPSLSPYSMDCFPQYEIQTGPHSHEVRAYVSADSAVDLRY